MLFLTQLWSFFFIYLLIFIFFCLSQVIVNQHLFWAHFLRPTKVLLLIFYYTRLYSFCSVACRILHGSCCDLACVLRMRHDVCSRSSPTRIHRFPFHVLCICDDCVCESVFFICGGWYLWFQFATINHRPIRRPCSHTYASDPQYYIREQ